MPRFQPESLLHLSIRKRNTRPHKKINDVSIRTVTYEYLRAIRTALPRDGKYYWGYCKKRPYGLVANGLMALWPYIYDSLFCCTDLLHIPLKVTQGYL